MRTLVVAAALLGMIASLQAKEADSLRGMQNSIDAAKTVREQSKRLTAWEAHQNYAG